MGDDSCITAALVLRCWQQCRVAAASARGFHQLSPRTAERMMLPIDWGEDTVSGTLYYDGQIIAIVGGRAAASSNHPAAGRSSYCGIVGSGLAVDTVEKSSNNQSAATKRVTATGREKWQRI